MKIDPTTITPEQGSALLRHMEERVDATAVANNTLIAKLALIAKECSPDNAEKIIQTINEWSSFQNALSNASDEEILRIVTAQQSDRSKLQ